MENIKKEQETEKEKNLKKAELYLQENIQKEKDGMEKEKNIIMKIN